MKRKLWLTSLLLGSLYLFSRCGPQGLNNQLSCTPNVIDTGLSIKVTSLGGNAYTFELCANSNPSNAVYSVYGASSMSGLNSGFNVNAAARTPTHITGANFPGNTFQITFNSADNDFAIYPDQYNGVNYTLDNSGTPLVSAHIIPGR